MTDKQVLTIPFTGGLAGKIAEQIRPPGSNFSVTNCRQAKSGEWRNAPALNQWGVSSRTGQSYSVLAPVASGGVGGARGLAGFRSNMGFNAPSPTATALNCVDFFDPSNGVTANASSTFADGLASPSVWTRRVEAYDPTVILGSGAYQNPKVVAFATNGDANAPLDMVAWISGTTAYLSFVNVLTGAVIYRSVIGPASNIKCAYANSNYFGLCVLSGGNVDLYSFNASVAGGVSVTTYVGVLTGLTGTNLDVANNGNVNSPNILIAGTAVTTFNLKTNVVNLSSGFAFGPSTIAQASNKCVSILESNYAAGTANFIAVGTTGSVVVVRTTSIGAFSSQDTAAAFTPMAVTGVALPTLGDWLIAIDDGTPGAPRIWWNSKTSGVVGSAALFSPGASSWLRLESKAWSAAAPNNSNARMSFIGGHHTGVGGPDPQDSYYEFTISVALGASTQIQAAIVPLQAGTGISISGDLRQVGQRGPYSWAFASTHSMTFTSSAGTLSYNLGISTWTTTTRDPRLSGQSLWANFLNHGPPVQVGLTTYVPVGQGIQICGNGVYSVGPMAIPLIPTLTQTTGGSLTLLGTYLYRFVNVLVDPYGNIYRSPPSSAQSITLTGANNQVSVFYAYCPDNGGNGVANHVKTEIYRTAAGSTVFQKVGEVMSPYGWGNDNGGSFVDTASDVNLASGDFLYSIGEVQNSIPPRPLHYCVANKRLWAVDADFPQVVRFTKTFRKGFMPEFVDAFYVDLTDDQGGITGIQPLDDRVVVFKKNAIYVISGDGPDLTGAGANPTFTRVTTGVGSAPGPMQCSTGEEVYFLDAGQGIWKIDRGLAVTYAGAALDDYLVTSPISPSPVGGGDTIVQCFVAPDRNEVWFIGLANAYVFDLINGCWIVQSIPSPIALSYAQSCAAYDGAHVAIAQGKLSDSTLALYWDSPTSSLTPASTQLGSWQTAWIEPNQGMDSWIRLWRLRVIGQQQSSTAIGGTATITITVDFDKDPASPKQLVRTSTLNASGVPAGNELPLFDGELRMNVRCSSFRVKVAIASTGSWQLHFEGLSAELGMLSGMRRLAPANRMA